jgi:hypothetical protein
MKKNLLTPNAEIRVIPGTQYILLPDNKVARLLTPTVRPSGDNYNLRIDGRTRQFTLEAIKAIIAGADPATVGNK